MKHKDIYIDIGLKIKARRKELGYSQEKIAEILAVSTRLVQKYEKALVRIPLDILLNLCRILEVDLSYFLKEADSAKSLNPKLSPSQNNSEYYKHVSMLREIYENKSEDLITVVNTGIENVYSALKKQNKQKENPKPVQKKRLAGNSK